MQSSTEQLTHYNTEEILDNPEGITSQTVSEKIMSICKNTIRWELFLDLLLALSVVVFLAVLEFGTIPQQNIGFYCNDPKISFKFMGDTISISLLLIVCFLVPVLVMWIAEYTCHPINEYSKDLGCAGSRSKQIWLWYSHYSVGMISLIFMCTVIKTLIGEPRPHFLDTCKPREAENCTDKYVDSYTCTNTVDSNWFVSDSSKSFPSGHSALSMFTTVFIVWYLQNRLPNRTFFLKPWLQCMMCLWNVICSITRISDNRHHWWDVLAGDALGLAFSVLTVAVLCQKFRFNRNVLQNFNDPLENGQFGCNNMRQENVKKLLQETTVDLQEARELKNVKPTSWKE